jgi:hypothetical protein
MNLAESWSAEHNMRWGLDRIIDITLTFAAGEPNQRRIIKKDITVAISLCLSA